MKLIAANIRRDALDDLVAALTRTRASGMTVTDVRVYSDAGEHLTYRGLDVPLAIVRTRVEIVVENEGVEDVVRLIVQLGARFRDNELVCVMPVTDTYRIRTGDWEG